jgi:uncharacterized membrane protein YphA (DoxX/SURF4 family)
MNPTVRKVTLTLRWVFGLVPIVAGVDKFADILVKWDKYLAPQIPQTLSIDPHTFMIVVGVIEIIAGLIVLWRAEIGAWIVAVWLLAIVLNLIVTGYYDIAVRDAVLAITAICLALLAKLEPSRPVWSS